MFPDKANVNNPTKPKETLTFDLCWIKYLAATALLSVFRASVKIELVDQIALRSNRINSERRRREKLALAVRA
jgi:hypothetical protein